MGAGLSGSCSSLGPPDAASRAFTQGRQELQLPEPPGCSRWERGCCYQYGGCQPDKDSQSAVIETREVFRGRLGDRGLPSPFSSSCVGLNPSPVPSRRAPHAEDSPPPPVSPPPRLSPSCWDVGEGAVPGAENSARIEGESCGFVAGLPQVSFLTCFSLLFFFLEGFWGESE